MAETILQTFDDDVLPAGYCRPYTGKRSGRDVYEYLNGSRIIVRGFDDPTKLLSGEMDMAIIFQAEECEEDKVMGLVTRFSGQALPFKQLGLDVNPRGRTHWIKEKIDDQKVHCFDFTYQDNPVMYDPDRREYTEFGAWYIANLEATLAGHQLQRLRYGKWSNPEGARFKNADRSTQGFRLYDVFPQGMPSWWKRFLHGDWGRADPYCCLWTAVDEDGHYWTYKEDYTAGYEATEQAERIVLMSPANERFEADYLDQSMWSTEKSFGGSETLGPAAQQYQKVFDAANIAATFDRFGPVTKGARNIDEVHYVTLEHLLTSGTWHIELGCVNLWKQLEDACYYKDPRTGFQYNRVNPYQTRKVFQDHALEAAGYGLHDRAPITTIEDANLPIDFEQVMIRARQEQMNAIRRSVDSERRGRGGNDRLF